MHQRRADCLTIRRKSIFPCLLKALESVEQNSLDFQRQAIAPVRRDDMPPADGSSIVAKIAAVLRLSADGSAVRTSLVAGGG